MLASLIPGGNQKNERLKALLTAKNTNISSVYPVLRAIQTKKEINNIINNSGEVNYPGTLENYLVSRQARIEKFEPFSQISIADYAGYTQHVLLKDADQMSMAVSLEVREPFFDQDLVEYVLGLPDKFKGN